MANAAGGTIVYGLSERDHVAEALDEGAEPMITAEWIDQVLTSNVEPKIAELLIHRVPLDAGRNAFVIEVPQATALAPHQVKAGDFRYWTRRNTTCERLLDHEIRDLMRRASTPELSLAFSLRPNELAPDLYDLSVVGLNASAEPALYWSLDFILDRETTLNSVDEQYQSPNWLGFIHQDVAINRGGDSHPALQYSRNFGVPTSMPLFRERTFEVAKRSIFIKKNTLYPWAYVISCPGYHAERHGHFARSEGEGVEIAIYKNGMVE